MSYAAGMVLGMSVGQKIFELFAKGVPVTENKIISVVPQVKLVHSLQERRRYSIAALKDNAGLAAVLETYLIKLDYVKKVNANAITGSLIIEFSRDAKKIDELMDYLAEHVFGVADSAKKRKNIELASLGSQIYDFFIFWDNYLKEKTANAVDLRSFTAFMFMVTGLRKLLLQKQLPAAPQLLWWSFSLLRRWGCR
ncbi:HMA2 domain-containing protein [Pectinatus haikarae]|uniref:Urease gamma subunit n=1 Tax=Pectinatus haikarae TaxID=349096 RepID=A0ABT9Y620_9FIRM|nr:hypothetical protein [Pectinatus haikarae]MDQ0203285.1 urease gamma subunit [Pectinatus haikarae]